MLVCGRTESNLAYERDRLPELCQHAHFRAIQRTETFTSKTVVEIHVCVQDSLLFLQTSAPVCPNKCQVVPSTIQWTWTAISQLRVDSSFQAEHFSKTSADCRIAALILNTAAYTANQELYIEESIHRLPDATMPNLYTCTCDSSVPSLHFMLFDCFLWKSLMIFSLRSLILCGSLFSFSATLEAAMSK
jgi:hypothetical protein